MADRTLRIGIDARELVGRPTGVGRYLTALLRHWTADDTPHRLVLFAADGAPREAPWPASRVDWVTLPAAAAGTVWEQTRLPLAAARARIDVFFAPAYTAPVALSRPLVLTIHDLSYFAHPEWFGPREGWRRRFFTTRAARRAAAIVTVSAFSAGEIVRYLGVGRDRVHVVRHGAPEPWGGSGHENCAARNSHDLPPTVLFVGTLLERRHVPELVAGFAEAARRVPNARLILAGDNRTRPPIDPRALAERAGVGAQVDYRQYVPDAELGALYDGARVFAFLSEYEGFALTPLEALARGVPIVLLDTPVAREVYGEAATYVPLAPAAIAEALVGLLSDAQAHAAAVTRGRRRLAAFSWARAAADTMALIEGAARGSAT